MSSEILKAPATKLARYTFRRYSWTWFPPNGAYDEVLAEYLTGMGDNVPPKAPDLFCLQPIIKLDDPKHRFTIYSLERCPTTERLHFQGYSEFTTPITQAAFKKLFDMPGVHLEPSHSDQQKNMTYVAKSETHVFGPWTHGVPAITQGSRTDLHAIYELVPQQATGNQMMRMMGPTGMRNLSLYQKAVRCYQHADPDDDIIRKRRRELRKKACEKKGLPFQLTDSDLSDGWSDDDDNVTKPSN